MPPTGEIARGGGERGGCEEVRRGGGREGKGGRSGGGGRSSRNDQRQKRDRQGRRTLEEEVGGYVDEVPESRNSGEDPLEGTGDGAVEVLQTVVVYRTHEWCTQSTDGGVGGCRSVPVPGRVKEEFTQGPSVDPRTVQESFRNNLLP